MNRINLCFALILSICFTLQFAGTSNAQRRGFDGSVRANWSEDGSRFWYRKNVGEDQYKFYKVEVANKSNEPVFDHERLAKLFSEELNEKVEATKLPVSRLSFSSVDSKIILHGRKSTWTLSLDSYELETASKTESAQKPGRFFERPRRSPQSDDETHIVIENRLPEMIQIFWIGFGGRPVGYGSVQPGDSFESSTYVGHVWQVRTGKTRFCFETLRDDNVIIDEQSLNNVNRGPEQAPERRRRGNANRRNRNAVSPDKTWRARVQNEDLWLVKDEEEVQISFDATKENTFRRDSSRARLMNMRYNQRDASESTPNVRWSPDSKHVIAFQTTVVDERKVYYIESSPEEQLQPKLREYIYAKPGDTIPVQTLRLFSVEKQSEIKLNNDLFKNPFSLNFLGWSETGDRFWFEYNQRGHQVLRVLQVTVADGKVTTIAEEKSDTFVHYSSQGKHVVRDLDDNELLWASERSGWNHLYRFNKLTGELINQVTSGEWNVKRIELVDDERKQIWFYAVGIAEDQDPYHEHFCRVNWDGTGMVQLTEGDGTHRIRFEQGRLYFFDTYSRVDMPHVTELRDAESGELICGFEAKQAQADFGERRITERFVAKGRDEETDIWGIIHWPINFDPDKKYPVVENIYAGPHDHHVPKSYRKRFGHQHRIADAGMIVVQIDGMGTAWRSKAFHDVCFKNLKDGGFPDRIAWIKAAAEKFPQMDVSRVGIYGGSAGGQNAMAALLWHNDFYKVAVADCGCHDNRMDKIWWNEQWMGWPVDESYKENSNMENAHLLKGNLMLLVGELDRNVDPASTTQVVKKLIDADKDFEFVLVAGAGHGSAETPWASRKRLNFLKAHLGVK